MGIRLQVKRQIGQCFLSQSLWSEGISTAQGTSICQNGALSWLKALGAWWGEDPEMIYRELPFWGGGAKRAPERFFAKAGIQPGTIAFIENVHIPGIHPGIILAK